MTPGGRQAPRGSRTGRHGRGLLLGAAVLAALANAAAAADFKVVLSDDAAPYQEAYQAIRVRLEGRGHSVTPLYADRVDAAALGKAALIVAVGVKATESLMPLPWVPSVLSILVPRDWYRRRGLPELKRSGVKEVSALFVDQPFERQAHLIRQAFPEARRVGLVSGENQAALVKEIEFEMRRHGLALVHETVSTQRDLIPSLENVLAASDVLLALPDPVTFSRNTAQSIFLTSYRYRDPVLGYSRSMTRAGALVSLYSTPEQVGRQAAEWIEKAWQKPSPSLPEAAHPAYFSVSVNQQVARSLGLSLPGEAALADALGAEP